jgi:hypothetical protein
MNLINKEINDFKNYICKSKETGVVVLPNFCEVITAPKDVKIKVMDEKVVKSEHIFSPLQYINLVTGKRYKDLVIDLKTVELVLSQNGLDNLWSYPLNEIDEVMEQCSAVVLVKLYSFETGDDEYRWFEIPEEVNVNE